jgi:hypothetical protein
MNSFLTHGRANLLVPALLAGALTTWCAAAQASDTVDITAGYSYSSPDYLANSYFTVTNSSNASLGSISFSSVGDGNTGTSDAATWSWSGVTLAAGQTVTLYFGDASTTVSGSGYGFSSNYGWTYAGNDQTYGFSALVDGVATISATFLPVATSASASFLGNDTHGDYLPSAVSVQVASIAISAVPEPSVGLMFGFGVAVLVGSGCKRRAA